MIISIFNQVISSLGNFLFSLFLIRILEPIDFGMYSIGLIIILAIGSFVQGLLLIPMIVHFPSKDEAEHSSFGLNVLALVLIFWIGLIFVFVAFSVTVASAWDLRNYSLILAVSTGAFAVKEFFIRYAFVRESNKHHALFVNVALVSTLFVGGLLFYNKMGIEGAMLLFGVAQLVAAAIGFAFCDIEFTGLKKAAIIATFREMLPHGKWGGLSSVIYSVRSNAHTIIVAAFLGTTEVAVMSAARVLVTPATLLIPAISNIALPRFSRVLNQDGPPALIKYAGKILGIIASVAFIYSIILVVAWPLVATVVLSEKYDDTLELVVLWCAYAVCLTLRSGMEWSGQAMKLFKQITSIYFFAALATLSMVALLTKNFAVSGAIYGAIAGELIVVALLLWVIIRKTRNG